MFEHEDTALAVVAGYVDTLGFIALFGMFTAHVTGNFVLIGADLAASGPGVVLKLLAFPAFVVGIVLSSVALKVAPETVRRRPDRMLFLLQAAGLLAFLLAGNAARPIIDANAWPVLLCGMVGALAMGVQNAHAKLVPKLGIANTVMTGNVTQVVLDIVELLLWRNDGPTTRHDIHARFRKTAPAVLGFAVGAIGGALAYLHFAFWALLLPIAMLVGLAAVARHLPR